MHFLGAFLEVLQMNFLSFHYINIISVGTILLAQRYPTSSEVTQDLVLIHFSAT